MSPLCPGNDRLAGHQRGFLRWRGLHHDDGFAAYHVEPMATDLTTWPILPKDRSMREDLYGFRKRLRRSNGRCRGNSLVRREREDHRTDSSWGARWKDFLDTECATRIGGNRRCGPHTTDDTSYCAPACVLADRADDWRDKAGFHPVEA